MNKLVDKEVFKSQLASQFLRSNLVSSIVQSEYKFSDKALLSVGNR